MAVARPADALSEGPWPASVPIFQVEIAGGSLLGQLVVAFISQAFPGSRVERLEGDDGECVSVSVLGSPSTRQLFVFSHDPEPTTLGRLIASGHSVLTLEARSDELNAGLKALVEAAPPFISDSLVRGLALRSLATAQPRPDDHLTARQLDVLVLLNLGYSNAEIAKELVVSQHTVRSHLQGISAKLGVSGRARITVEARRRGWLSPSPAPQSTWQRPAAS